MEVLLALEHPAELGEIRLQPILLGILPRGVSEVPDHLVGRVFQCGHFAARLDRDRSREVAFRHGGRDLGNRPHLSREVGGQLIDVLGQSFPGAGHTRNPRLAAKHALNADLACDTRHLRSKRAQLVHHGVDGVLQLQDLALDVDCNLLRQVAARHRLGHVRDVAHLRGEVAGHRVDALGQVLPRPRHALHVGLPAEPPVRSDFARDPRDFGGE
jgi:hypothetical protein